VPGEVEFINGGPPCQVSYFTQGNAWCLLILCTADWHCIFS
jgi:hypothetical protein